MLCVPMLSRRKRYHFEAVVKLHSLTAVPYVNAVTFAKLRLLDTRHSSQYSTRAEIRNHTVSWNTEHRFICKFRGNVGNNVLEPKFLKISIRMETKGGKSFYKVGFVSVNLASFATMGSTTCRRRYILEGYDEKHKRQDNSLLLVSFSMRQLYGDTCFRIPPENLSNCLVEPPDSDDGENLITVVNNGSSSVDRSRINTGPIDTLLSSDVVMSNSHASFERRLHTLNLDPLVPATECYSGQPVRSTSSISPCFSRISHLVHHSTSGTDLLASSSGTTVIFSTRNSPSMPPDKLSTLLTELFPTAASEPPLIDNTPRPTNAKSTDSDTASQDTSELPISGDSVAHIDAQQTPDIVPVTTYSRRSASCPATHQPLLTTGLRSSAIVATGDHITHPASVETDMKADKVFARNALEDVSGRVGSAEAVLVTSCSSSSSVTPTSFSSTPGSTATGSPVAHATFHADSLRKRDPLLPSVAVTVDPSTSLEPIISGLYDTPGFQDEDSACRSLPLPPHYSAYRRRCDPLPPPTSIMADSLHHKPSDYFATDTGLLLPSRRRKSRPVADFAFPPPQMCILRPTRDPRDLSTSDDVPENVDIEARDRQTDLSLTSYRSSGLESRSSGYQSHSRQSSLESQAVTGSTCALISTQSGSIITNSTGCVATVPRISWNSPLETSTDKNQTAPS